MTSSLVGSEMCIRDSVKSAFRQSDEAQRQGISVFCRPNGDIRARLSQLTVSYTHLTLPTICSV
eukprot:11487984-Prorocentrum_lima.AAC.1